jgi:hypothetical protein
MLCPICAQLEKAVATSHRPEEPDTLSGLNESGMRIRALQRKERIANAEMKLEKHQRSCQKMVREPAA